jgi:hypothetical protein
MGNVAIKLDKEPGVLGAVSEESETEWKDDMEDAGACFGMSLGVDNVFGG